MHFATKKHFFLTVLVLFTIGNLFSQVTVDTLYWGPGPIEDDCWGLKYTCDEPNFKPDSVMFCLVSKTDLKKVPMVIYAPNGTSYETMATLDLKLVEPLTGGIEDSPCHGQPYECHEALWMDVTDANTIRISFNMGGVKMAYNAGDTKFALSLLDRDGNVLFATNETRRQHPLFPNGQLTDYEIILPGKLLSWSLHENSLSGITMRTNYASDLKRDTLVNAYSINIVKKSLHSPLYERVAAIRLDLLSPSSKYDNLLTQIENVQNKMKKLIKSGISTQEDLFFVRDFLLAPNCLSGLYSEDVESCIEYNFAGGLDNAMAYFWYNENLGNLFEIEDLPIPIASLPQMSLMLSEFKVNVDKEKSYRLPNHPATAPRTFIADNLLPFTNEIPSYRQCWRFIELVNSWGELMKQAMEVLLKAADNGDLAAQLYMGMMIEKNYFLAFSFGDSYGGLDSGVEIVKELYGTSVHWYLLAALNGSVEGKKELARLSRSEEEYVKYQYIEESGKELEQWHELLNSRSINQEKYNKVKSLLRIDEAE